MKVTVIDIVLLLVLGAASVAFAAGSGFRGWGVLVAIVGGCSLIAGTAAAGARVRGREVR